MPLVALYSYYFKGIKKPVIIQACNKEQARIYLRDFMREDPDYYTKTEEDIYSETVAEPVTGISERIIQGKKYLWAGLAYGQNGWVTEEEFKALYQ